MTYICRKGLCYHKNMSLALDNCIVLWMHHIYNQQICSLSFIYSHSLLYESVHFHNKMYFISLNALILEVKFSLILQTIPCSLKVQFISHNNSALTLLSATLQIICLCWSICYQFSLHDLAILCRANRMANSLNCQPVSYKENVPVSCDIIEGITESWNF